jgi:hypothetical protein
MRLLFDVDCVELAIYEQRRAEAQAALIDREAKTVAPVSGCFSSATLFQQRRNAHEVVGEHGRCNP